ncbi:hypothetical protein WT54_05690 [Burkholderia territorii]|nr:hypothetical protein WT54_05690 [Burkholderia territorii]
MLVFGVLLIRQLGLQAQLTDVFGRRHRTESPVRRLSLYSTRHRSICSLASASDVNQCTFRHSLRSVPLNESTNALSVGLPGRLKAISTL